VASLFLTSGSLTPLAARGTVCRSQCFGVYRFRRNRQSTASRHAHWRTQTATSSGRQPIPLSR
jgi:hypothetical protein